MLKSYIVTLYLNTSRTITVCAEDEDEAIELAYEQNDKDLEGIDLDDLTVEVSVEEEDDGAYDRARDLAQEG